VEFDDPEETEIEEMPQNVPKEEQGDFVRPINRFILF
jgi:hypothetical protein